MSWIPAFAGMTDAQELRTSGTFRKLLAIVHWVRSQLFWKILGLYALLSALAVTGLVVALRTKLSAQHATAVMSECRDLLKLNLQAESTLDVPTDPEKWTRSVTDSGMIVASAFVSGTSRTDGSSPPFDVSPALLRSVVDESRGKGESRRRIATATGRHLVILAQAIGADVAPSESVASTRAAESERAVTTAVLVCDQTISLQRQRGFLTGIARAAGFTWLIGVLCVGVVTFGLVEPLRQMTERLADTAGRAERQDLLLQISDRHDELGEVAQSLTQLEDEREEQIRWLELANEESRSTAELLSAVLDSMIEGVISIDQDERLLYMNSAARTLLMISESIVVGRRIYEAVRIPAFLETVAETLRAETRQSIEFRSLRERRHLSMLVSPFSGSRRSGAVIVVRDVSEMRRLESMRRDFVSGVSHELKTPLTAIQACTDTLLEGALDDRETAERFLRQINDQSERLMRLILGMLQLARVESGAEVFRPEQVTVLPVVEDVLTALEPITVPVRVRLKAIGNQDLEVNADRQALRTILTNLVENAIRHSHDDGLVEVELTSTASIIVRDFGVGIAAEHLPRVFERFYRVERDRSRSRGGTGLGLAIVKHLCQAMSATIEVRSEPGVRTEFVVKFPIAP